MKGTWTRRDFTLPEAPVDLSRYVGIRLHYRVESRPSKDVAVYILTEQGHQYFHYIPDSIGEHTIDLSFSDFRIYGDSPPDIDLENMQKIRFHARGEEQEGGSTLTMYIWDITFIKKDD